MIIKKISEKLYEIEVEVQDIIYGNTKVDHFIGWDQVETTTLKLRCKDCTVMVFKKNMTHFKNIESGFQFKAIVSKWKDNIYNFKKIIE